MKNILKKIGQSIFSIFIMIAMAGGGIVFAMFVIALIIGESGNAMALSAKNTVMPIFIICATIAMVGGLLELYASGEHELTMGDDK